MVRKIDEAGGAEGMEDLGSYGLFLGMISIEESGEINYLRELRTKLETGIRELRGAIQVSQGHLGTQL